MKFEEKDIGKEVKLYDDNKIKSYKLKKIIDSDTYKFVNPEDPTDIYYLFPDSDYLLIEEESSSPAPAAPKEETSHAIGGRRSRKTKKQSSSKKQRKTRRLAIK